MAAMMAWIITAREVHSLRMQEIIVFVTSTQYGLRYLLQPTERYGGKRYENNSWKDFLECDLFESQEKYNRVRVLSRQHGLYLRNSRKQRCTSLPEQSFCEKSQKAEGDGGALADNKGFQ